ncbi:hypothetical protein CDLVIII_0428 [Clostridium sp. DL-VIII]|uniref:hypothetical protein n=1 Tax=Clostridium sp. DL-VIII TaxID=641107 RepID=UPI00023AF340|nr:hypothetical protein [Clostridium sp. DL-VIII]EHI97165.1 hypothetical protein CDLVIII_0428 [Clostridium sp. DL-VIII]
MEEIYISRLGIGVSIIEPNSEVKRKIDALVKKDMVAAFKELVFNCVVKPDLKDPKLKKTFPCTNESDIVCKLFTLGELKYIADEIIGIKNDVVTKRIKSY